MWDNFAFNSLYLCVWPFCLQFGWWPLSEVLPDVADSGVTYSEAADSEVADSEVDGLTGSYLVTFTTWTF